MRHAASIKRPETSAIRLRARAALAFRLDMVPRASCSGCKQSARMIGAKACLADPPVLRLRSLEPGLFLIADVRRKDLPGLEQRELLQGSALFFAVTQRGHLHLHAVARLDG